MSNAGDAGTKLGHQLGQAPIHACANGAAPGADVLLKSTGE
jgi:hypothetical protein